MKQCLDTLPLWRSALFVPANNEKFVNKAHTRGADSIILDLEDSIPVAHKRSARSSVPAAAAQLSRHGIDVLVRINRNWRLAIRDMEAVVGEHVGTIVVPKVVDARHINFVEEVLDELEVARGMRCGETRILAFIEGVDGLTNVDAIATASDRLMGLYLGAEDFALEVGMSSTQQTLLGPCQRIVFAARRAGILPLGFVGSIADYSDLNSFRITIREARDLGFTGGLAIHPTQVRILNEEFTPSKEEVEYARGVVDAYEAACATDQGAVEYNGKMIDAPVAARARETIRIFESITD